MEYIKFLTGVTFISGLVGYLAKQIIKIGFDKDLEKYKNKLQSIALEHQVVFTKLHVERAEVIKSIYSKLINIERVLQDIAVNPKGSLDKNSIDEIVDMKHFFQDNRIFFNKELAEQLDIIINCAHNAFFEVSWNGDYQLHEITDDKIKKETIEARLSGWDKVKNEIPKLKDELESEFRKLLGVY